MDTLRLLIAIAMGGGALWLIGAFAVDYAEATGTPWQRALTASSESATMLWSKFVMLCGLASSGLVALADYLGDPGLSGAIQAAMKPQYVAAFTLVVAVVTIYARRRTLPKS